MKKLKKGKKFLIKNVFFSTFLIAIGVVLVKLLIPEQYRFIEPISIYGTIISSVIFVYGFILAPTLSEYKESEKLLNEISNSIDNARDDAIYFSTLGKGFNSEHFLRSLSEISEGMYYEIADGKSFDKQPYFENAYVLLANSEKQGLTANHIIRMKSELSNLRKNYSRLQEIKNGHAVPKIIHDLKNFITAMVIVTLLFLDIGKEHFDWVSHFQEALMIFLISFLYVYLSFIINGFENPFDKRRFKGFLDVTFLLEKSEKMFSQIKNN